MAVGLIEAMTTKWDPENYRDTYTERVDRLVEAKQNEEVVTQTEAAPEGKVVDLMQALQASLEQAKSHKPGNRQAEKVETHKAREGDKGDGRTRKAGKGEAAAPSAE